MPTPELAKTAERDRNAACRRTDAAGDRTSVGGNGSPGRGDHQGRGADRRRQCHQLDAASRCKGKIVKRLPFFYGWMIVAVTFVTMAIGVNARTAFSLFFPPIIDEFGWERGVTAGAFSFGFVVSGVVSPLIGRLMDRYGPRGGDGTRRRADGRRPAAGAADDAALASLSHHRRAGRRRQRLPRLFRPIAVPAELVHPPPRPRDGAGVRRRRHRLGDPAALGAAHDRADRLAHRLHGDGHHGPGRAGADQSACCASGPRISACCRTATPRRRRPRPKPVSNIVDPVWAGTDWTLARALRTARFWWIALGYFCGLYIWYAVQVHQTKYLLDIGFSASVGGLGARRGQPARHSRPDLARPSLRPHRPRMGLGDQLPRFCDLLRGADRAEICAEPCRWST